MKSFMTRRSFIKGAAGVTAAVGFGATGWLKHLQEVQASQYALAESIYAGSCRGNCFNGCFVNVHVRDNKVVRVSARELPTPEYNRICAKGLTMMHRMYSAERLKYPLKRVGARGAGQWEQITWEEALDTVATKWTELQQEYGNSSFAYFPGSGNYGLLSGMGTGGAAARLRNVTNSTHIGFAVDEALFRIGRTFTGWGRNFVLNEAKDLTNAKTIICWGANIPVSQLQNMHFILDAQEKGAKYIVIDPTSNWNSSKADIHVPIRPGSDGVLAMAMMNIVLRENWQDYDFLRSSTVGPFLVKESDGMYLRLSDLGLAEEDDDAIVVRSSDGSVGLPGEIPDAVLEGTFEINGIQVTTAYSLLIDSIKEYTPEKASEICDIPVSMIEEITRIYVTEGPSTIYQSFGVNHYVNAHYSYFSIFALAALTGNMCKEGASIGMGFVSGSVVANVVGTLFPPGSPGPSPTVLVTELNDVLDTGMYGDIPINLKGMYINCVNPPATMADRQHTLSWMHKLDFIAVSDVTMTETAQNADIILPAAHWFEVLDANFSAQLNPYFMWQEKAVDPPHGCKSNFEIHKLLAQRMGVGSFFDMGEEEFISLFVDSPAMRALGVTMEELREKKAIKGLPGDNFVSFEGGVFGTATGRAQFYQEVVIPDYDIGQEWDISKERLPHWEPPNEAWFENSLIERFPLHLISENTMLRTHSQWWEVPLLMEILKEPYLKISPADAERYGINDQDMVRVYNDRGHVVLRAHVNRGIKPGIIVHPRGWEACQYVSGHCQDLICSTINRVNANQAFYDVLVAIERV